MDIIEMTRELGKAIQQDERYVAYTLAKMIMMQSFRRLSMTLIRKEHLLMRSLARKIKIQI